MRGATLTCVAAQLGLETSFKLSRLTLIHGGQTYNSQSGRGRYCKDGIDLSDRQPRPLSLA